VTTRSGLPYVTCRVCSN